MKKLDKTLFISQVDIHRRDDCVHYDRCLEVASAAQYKSFSCLGCKTYTCAGPANLEPFIYKRQAEAFPSGDHLLGDEALGGTTVDGEGGDDSS